MAETKTNSEQVVREYARIWNEQEFSKLPDVIDPSFTFVSPAAGTIEGRANVRAYAEEIVEGFSDFEVTVHEMLSDENLVMSEGTLSGTHDGEYNEIPPTHETFEVPEMAIFVVEDGKLQEERVYYDQQDFLGQLGLLEE